MAEISIHALLAESDTPAGRPVGPPQGYFYPRSPCGERPSMPNPGKVKVVISIHALLAESDGFRQFRGFFLVGNFYPRSPCGERQDNTASRIAAENDFYPRSPCGERQFQKLHQVRHMQFLSTLSLRRATLAPKQNPTQQRISIHALLAESDLIIMLYDTTALVFLSTLSLRRATPRMVRKPATRRFLSTLSLRRATLWACPAGCVC